jgi:hypothetical protein
MQGIIVQDFIVILCYAWVVCTLHEQRMPCVGITLYATTHRRDMGWTGTLK